MEGQLTPVDHHALDRVAEADPDCFQRGAQCVGKLVEVGTVWTRALDRKDLVHLRCRSPLTGAFVVGEG